MRVLAARRRHEHESAAALPLHEPSDDTNRASEGERQAAEHGSSGWPAPLPFLVTEDGGVLEQDAEEIERPLDQRR